MRQGLLTIQRFTVLARRAVCLTALCCLLSSCAPINNHPSAVPNKSTTKSASVVRRSHYISNVSRTHLIRKEAPKTILGFKVPAALTFSHLTRFLSSKDESLDQVPAPLPDFPTVSDTQEVEEAIDSATIEDERSLLLLSEAERFAEFSENKTLSEIARGSLNRTLELAAPIKQSSTFKLSHRLMIIIALCIGVLVTCGYFVVSFILDDMRVRNSPRFGSMQ